MLFSGQKEARLIAHEVRIAVALYWGMICPAHVSYGYTL